MIIGALKEKNEPRISLVPAIVKKFMAIEGNEIYLEKDLTPIFSDDEYIKAGAKMFSRDEVLASSDIILLFNTLPLEDAAKVKKGAMVISQMDP